MGRKHCGAIQGVTRKAKYASQFARTAKNKKRKMAKHLAFNSRDLQSLAVLKKLL